MIIVGRYLLHRQIARGGMASIHIARLLGDVGFSRIVAAKRMHPELAEDSEFVAMFLDEARIASRVQHRNVVNVLDVVTLGDEVMLVQDYVHGVPLSALLRAAHEMNAHVPVPVAAAIACQILAGLHAAHETVDELGTPLHIVHRDVSPQNVLIAIDGTARLLDFGVAKAALSSHVTRKGTFKGKLGYSSPEQIRGEAQRASDIYSLAVVLWEMIVGRRMHSAQSDAQLIADIMEGRLESITQALAPERSWIGAYRWSQLEEIEPVICKALDSEPRRRWTTAAEMEEALAAVVPLASPADVAAWLRAVGKSFLDERERVIAEEEASWRRVAPTMQWPGKTTDEPEEVDDVLEVDAVLELSRPIAPPPPPSLLRRVPTAMIAMLGIMLVVLVALLARDLDSTAPPAAALATPAPAASPPPTEAPPPIDSPPTAESPPPTDSSQPPVEAGPVREMPAPTASAPPHGTPPRVTTQKRASRPRPSTPPPPPPPTPRAVAPTTDCTTPFYFEGRKKIFKPGCL